VGSLGENIKDKLKRKAVIDDCALLIEAEVGDKGGLSGIAIKTGYRAVRGLKPGMIEMSLDALLDDFAARVDPLWAECQAKKENPRAYFQRRSAEVANALLGVTDDRAKRSKHDLLVKTYQSLRGKAVEHIATAMPRFADLLVKHAA
jgi:hypothetical protein